MNKKEYSAFSHEALYAKSQLFISRGYSAKEASRDDEYQLWASLALELLAKSTLSNFHPALIADPQHSQSIFAACGFGKTVDVKTITASTLYKRLSTMSKQFDHRVKTFCEQIALRRNSEIHSGDSPFSGMNSKSWENHFWHAVHTLLAMQNRDISDWLSAEEAGKAKKLLEEAEKARGMAIVARIENHKKEFESAYKTKEDRDNAIDGSKQISPWSNPKKFSQNIDHFENEECLACCSRAIVGGIFWDEEVVDQDYHNGDYPPTESVDKYFTVEEFWCPICNLRLDGKAEIDTTGLPEEFIVSEEREIEFEPEYGND